jgi:hypothetical protein
MHNSSTTPSARRLEAHLTMLKSSLHRVYPAQDDQRFNELLRQLDGASSAGR